MQDAPSYFRLVQGILNWNKAWAQYGGTREAIPSIQPTSCSSEWQPGYKVK